MIEDSEMQGAKTPFAARILHDTRNKPETASVEGASYEGEGTEREGPMTSTVLGQSAPFPLTQCDVLLEFEGRLKAPAYCPRPEAIAPESDKLRVHG